MLKQLGSALAGLALALSLPASASAAYPNPGRVTGDTVGVHDPTMIKASNGSYILISTGNWLEIRTSTDRVNFRRIGSVWAANQPTWTFPYTLANNRSYLWAPDLSFRNGQYYLYYAASSFGSQRSAIFLATSPTAMPGTWTHRGLVIETSSANDFNAIDPNLIVDASGRWWLTLGSFWSGIKLIRIEPSTGLRHATDRTVYSLARRTVNSGSVEAPFIFRRNNFYYLFVSFDFCCRGTSSTYRTMVGRSTSITGPYTDRNGVNMFNGGGTEILATHDAVFGPGHPAVFQDVDATVLVYHYYWTNSQPTSGRLGINLIGWDSAGWPIVF
ncbi:MAG TPA: arabinan endo-1,5-alpha-L-arabinosidase [Candidatus Limnocylindrales bacterium]|nr:arabinan endo-1,5-alpha-L-arabinosidase [Candidatus Limnocylindrales bacterium]